MTKWTHLFASHHRINGTIHPSSHPSILQSIRLLRSSPQRLAWNSMAQRHILGDASPDTPTDNWERLPLLLLLHCQLWIESSTSTFTSIAGRGATSKAASQPASQPATGAVAWSKGSQSFGRQNMWSSINGIADRIPLNDWTENGNVVFGKMWWISIPSRKQIIPFILFYANIKGSHNLIPRTQKLSFVQPL